MATEPVSFRMNTELLAKVDREATQKGLTRTQVIERALGSWFVRGAAGGGMLPPGFTEQFESELRSLAESGGYLTVLTLDPTGRAWIFGGAVPQHDARLALESGFLTLHLREPDGMSVLASVPIPRGLIVAWAKEGGPGFRARAGHLWRAHDGNEFLSRSAAGIY